MVVIGLTGGIASGKSTVSNLLKELGAFIVDTDKIARDIVNPGEGAWQEITRSFGTAILRPDGTIDRGALGDIVFRKDAERLKLEAITHPRIKEEALAQAADAEAAGYQVIVLDVPLLLEVGWEHMVDSVWVVYVDSVTQIERLMLRNKLTRQQAIDRLNAQMPLAEKLQYADTVIDNSKDVACTAKQVQAAWRQIMAASKE